jgi:hypothetical protein
MFVVEFLSTCRGRGRIGVLVVVVVVVVYDAAPKKTKRRNNMVWRA